MRPFLLKDTPGNHISAMMLPFFLGLVGGPPIAVGTALTWWSTTRALNRMSATGNVSSRWNTWLFDETKKFLPGILLNKSLRGHLLRDERVPSTLPLDQVDSPLPGEVVHNRGDRTDYSLVEGRIVVLAQGDTLEELRRLARNLPGDAIREALSRPAEVGEMVDEEERDP